MSELSVCSKLKELADKAKEVEGKLFPFYGWQRDELENVYGAVALLLYRGGELGEELVKRLEIMRDALARMMFHANEMWVFCSGIAEVPRANLIDIKCSANGELMVSKDVAAKALNSALDILEHDMVMCEYHIKMFVSDAKIILGIIDEMKAKYKFEDLRKFSNADDVYNWVAVAYADAEYAAGGCYEAYKMVRGGLEAVKNELEKLLKPVKEEKKEGEG
jgi:hypothetical protein